MVIRGQHMTVAAVALMLAACASASEDSDLGFGQTSDSAETKLIVQNDYWGDTDVYALSGSNRMRLGSVMPGTTTKLQIPRQLLARQEITFQVDPVGPDGAFTFPPIQLRPGLTVELIIANNLRLSSYSVR